MIRTTVQVSGMRCGMCEAHVNDAVRAAFRVKKVTSSRKTGQTVILSETPLNPEQPDAEKRIEPDGEEADA